jgi:hypothetical protein
MDFCTHCGDPCLPVRCPLCGKILMDSCRECHDELAHDLIGPPPSSRPGLADTATASDLRYHGQGRHD